MVKKKQQAAQTGLAMSLIINNTVLQQMWYKYSTYLYEYDFATIFLRLFHD